MSRKKSADTATATTEPVSTKIMAYKGFDAAFLCRGHKFEVGKTYEVEGDIEACKNGFHACEYPLAVFDYYPPAGNRFALVELAGDTDVEGDKTAARKITILRELSIKDMTLAAVEYTTARAKIEEGATASGMRGAATASGTQGAATASGTQGAATASGTQGAATASGYQGAATASGYQGAATASGMRGAATASGMRGAATASGMQGAATASGYQGAATASGTQGAATASGDQGAATASGYQGAATASGTQGAATASGKFCGAYATGIYGSASGVAGSAIHLDERIDHYGHADHGKIIHVWAGIVGQDGIKPDTFYRLVDGKPAEASP